MTDNRFSPPVERPTCLDCKHGSLDHRADKVHCHHPMRPKGQADRVEVIRWFVGCPQHEPQGT